jgi:hypothetical protein
LEDNSRWAAQFGLESSYGYNHLSIKRRIGFGPRRLDRLTASPMNGRSAGL